MFFDTHCHLNFDVLAGQVDEVIERCVKQRVGALVVPSVDRKSWGAVRKLSQSHQMLYCAFGLHPWFIKQHSFNDLSLLESNLLVEGCVAIGEIGLDKAAGDYDFQLALFEAQLALAEKYRLPVILHCRRAHDDLLRLLSRFSLVGGVIHAFSGGVELLNRYVELGMYIGVGGVVTRDNALKVRKAVSAARLDRLVLETDSPDMSVASKGRGDHSEPADVVEVFDALCILRPEARDELEMALWRNSFALFLLDKH